MTVPIRGQDSLADFPKKDLLRQFTGGLVLRTRCKSSIQSSRRFALKPLGAGIGLEIIRVKGPAIELLVKPAEHADLGSAESFNPAIDEKIGA